MAFGGTAFGSSTFGSTETQVFATVEVATVQEPQLPAPDRTIPATVGALTAVEPAVSVDPTIPVSTATLTAVEPSIDARVASAQSITVSTGTLSTVEPSVFVSLDDSLTIGNTVRDDGTLELTGVRATHDRLTLSWTGHVTDLDALREFRDHAGDVTKTTDSDGSWEGLDRSDGTNEFSVKPPSSLRPPLDLAKHVVDQYRERGGDAGLVRDVQVRFLRTGPRDDSASLSESAASDEWEFQFSEGTIATTDVTAADAGPEGDVEFRARLDTDQTTVVLTSLTRLDAVSVEPVPDGDDFVRDNSPNSTNTVTINRPTDLGSEYLPDEGDYVVRDMTVRKDQPYRWVVDFTARKT